MKQTPMQFFEALSQIPRVSGNEEAAANFVETFAENRSYECRRDDLNNVVVVKPASPGFEEAETVMLQGHLDMVGEAASGAVHDFSKDPIRLVRDGDVMRAVGTTLGADDGVAVAYMMAILSDNTLRHPRLECVFTVQEETGLIGAAALDTSALRATRMINLDAGPEGVFLVSCAGGTRVRLSRELSFEPVRGRVWQVDVDGLSGGHSGSVIHLERANALVLAGIMADNLRCSGGRLVGVSGGDKANVIPVRAGFLIAMEKDPEQLLRILRDDIQKNWAMSDPRVTVEWRPAQADVMLDGSSSDAAIDLLLLLPHGVMSLSASMPGLPETSANLATAVIGPEGLEIGISLRSSAQMRMRQLIRRIKRTADLFDARMQTDSTYPGWSYEPVSPLRDTCVKVYTRLFDKAPAIEGIHAGLECGIFKNAMPNLDIVATGPLYGGMHTPDEWMDVPSFERTYLFLTTLLAELGAGRSLA